MSEDQEKFIDYIYDRENKKWYIWQGWLDYIDNHQDKMPHWVWRLSFNIDDYIRWIHKPRKRGVEEGFGLSSIGSKYILRNSGLAEGCDLDDLDWYEGYDEFDSLFDLHLYLRTSITSDETGLPLKEHSLYDICKNYDFEIYQKVNLDEHPDIRRGNNPHTQG
jgi:hypothetical protein